jgi:hypothetical protein
VITTVPAGVTKIVIQSRTHCKILSTQCLTRQRRTLFSTVFIDRRSGIATRLGRLSGPMTARRRPPLKLLSIAVPKCRSRQLYHICKRFAKCQNLMVLRSTYQAITSWWSKVSVTFLRGTEPQPNAQRSCRLYGRLEGSAEPQLICTRLVCEGAEPPSLTSRDAGRECRRQQCTNC